MKKSVRFLALLLAVVFLLAAFVSCGNTPGDGPSADEPGDNNTGDNTGDSNGGNNGDNTGENNGDNSGGNNGDNSGGNNGGNNGDNTGGNTDPLPTVDYVSELKLDMSSETLKQVVTVKNYVDGDTTHFHVPTSVDPSGILKARYLAINTPESTGKIEDYGKAASNFTKEKLKSATSILIESDNGQWNVDSTGGRYLVWVWYKTSEDAEYRNLNLEILQNGLAIPSNSGQNRYGETCMAAIAQARAQKLLVYSGVPDPDMYHGEAVELTLKELRTNIRDYEGIKVAFEGVVIKNSQETAYIEAYDEETGMYFGMTAYYGYGMSGTGLKILSVGNLVRIVGTVQYYETGGTWQVSGLSYQMMRPNDPSNIQLIESGHEAAYPLTDPATFKNGKVQVTVGVDEETGDDIVKTFDYAELALGSTLRMENLQVIRVYTTTNEDSASKGAMTLTCRAQDGTTVEIRTIVLRDADGNLVTAAAFEGKTIHVQGLVDYYSGNYQIKVFSVDSITIVE